MGASFGIAKGFGTEENGLDVKYIIRAEVAVLARRLLVKSNLI